MILKHSPVNPQKTRSDSEALGYALYDPRLDAGVKYVLIRADREMYRKKRRMKRE